MVKISFIERIGAKQLENISTNLQQDITESVDIIHAAFHTYLKHTADMVFIKDINLVYQFVSQPFVQMAGKESVSEILGRTDFEIFEKKELAKRYTDDDHKLLESGQNLTGYIEPLTDDHGHPRYSSTSKYILRDDSGTPIGILGFSHDITREYIARRRHQQELRYLFELPEDTYAVLFMDIDDWRIIRHQRHTVGDQILDICETMEAFAENAVQCLADPDDLATQEFYQTLSQESMLKISDSGTRHHTLEYLRHMPNGEDLWVRTDINFLIDPENGHLCAIWTLRNINSEIQESLNLQHAAERDEMTGLLNRASTTRQIHQTLQADSQAQHALFIIDVDNFKSLNDTYGHQAGDRFLVTLATALRKCFRDNDVVGRIGGDEFFVLMKNVPSAMIVAEKASTLLGISQVFCDEHPDLRLSISIGIGMCPLNGNTLEELYTNADKALYQAKHKGKNQFVFA